MRKNMNSIKVEGYVYQSSGLKLRETGPNSKKPGTPFISGTLDIATDEEGMNIVSVNFTYVTDTYASGKPNNTFTTLKTIMENSDKTWLEGGKENAFKVRCDGSLGLNDFISSQDGSQISVKRNEGSFVNIVNALNEDVDARSTFQADMLITNVTRKEATEDNNIDKDYVVVHGALFDFRNSILPMDLYVKNEAGMDYFESRGATASDPVYTKVWGKIISNNVKIEREEESAFGAPSVRVFERTNREWVITGTAVVPYDFGDETVLTVDEVKEATKKREELWADIKKRNDEWQASRANPVTPTTSAPKAAVNNIPFNF